ncbi:hypothetical protein ACFOEY_20140 [Paracandidimonas soli]
MVAFWRGGQRHGREVDHRILEPLDDVVPGPHELPVFGGIEWA